MVRPMVHSTKHYVQYPIDAIAAGTKQGVVIVNSVAVVNKNLASEVEEGSSVKAVFFELWLHSDTQDGEFVVTVSKEQENGTGPTFAQMAALNSYDNKKNILYTSQGLTSNDAISGPINIIRSWIKIPKSKQRMGLGDTINLSISNVSADTLNRCGMSTYKEYS